MRHRLAFILPIYLATGAACYMAAFWLRFDFAPDADVAALVFRTLPLVLAVKLATCAVLGEWRRTLRYATLADVVWLAAGASLAAGLLLVMNLTLFEALGCPIPRSVIAIDWALAILAGGLLRVAARGYSEMLRPALCRQPGRRTLIYGTSCEAIAILRGLQATHSDCQAVGLIDERPQKAGDLIAGLQVYSTCGGWKRLARKSGAGHVLIPGSVAGRLVRQITANCAEAGLKVSVIPAVQEIVGGRFSLTIRDVTISDLLRREPAELDLAAIRQYVTGRRVLVTGAAGSIGSELSRQILQLEPEILVLVDQSEFGVFSIEGELRGAPALRTALHFLVADVTDRHTVARLMEVHRPHLVFHAAAYKHVPLMEQNPREAVRNNVLGTKVVADLASEHGVERFVLISTDKAVRPTSVMGATKLVAEKYVQWLSGRSRTRFVTVRFGNVLNSAGSVVPTFRRQIEEGGPVTVTHPEMVRFFMTIPEAVQLVLQAGAVGGSGDVLILEMGEPVRIVDLARDMIHLSGLRCPEDIEIVFTGMRPGEKLYEELFYESEAGTRKVHEKIFRARRDPSRLAGVDRDVARLDALLRGPDDAAAVLWEIVDRFVAAEAAPVKSLKSAA